MNHRRFLIQLVSIFLVTGGVLAFLHIFQQFSPYKAFSLSTLAFFALLSMAMYFPAAKAAQSTDRNAFTRLVMVFTFVKMFLAGAFVIGYHRIFQPSDTMFLIPFFWVYVVFTGFETAFMSKPAQSRS
jgi:hypothetical protein